MHVRISTLDHTDEKLFFPIQQLGNKDIMMSSQSQFGQMDPSAKFPRPFQATYHKTVRGGNI